MVDGDGRCFSWAANETIIKPPLDMVREYPIGGEYASIRGEIIIVSASTIPNTVKAVDLKTGDVLWTFEFSGCNASIGHMAAISDSLVPCGAQLS